MYTKIINAIDSAQKAQRNYNLNHSVPKGDLDTMIYAAINSPSKQNETHYCLYVYTDQEIIREIYNHTKKFTLVKDSSDKQWGDDNGKYWQDDTNSVKNSQILANVLFAYADASGEARGGTHQVGKENQDSNAYQLYQEQKNISIGISVGELILTANLLGYKTGICSAMDSKPIKKILNTENRVKLLVGAGVPDPTLNRRAHPEVLNKDVPLKHKTGNDLENWKFPSFVKNTRVIINGVEFE